MCQRAKIHRHNKTPLSSYELPNSRFEHINIDLIGPLPTETVLQFDDNRSVQKLARSHPDNWHDGQNGRHFDKQLNFPIQHAAPLRITFELGRQLESTLFSELSKLLGVNHLKTTSYHPQATGLIERWHRTFKAAIMMCQQTANRSESLPDLRS